MLGGDALGDNELVENLIDVAMMENPETINIGHAVAQIAAEFDDTNEMWQVARFLRISEGEISVEKLMGFLDDFETDSFAGEGIRKMFETVENHVGDIGDGVEEHRYRRRGKDECGNPRRFLFEVVAQIGDLFLGIDFGKFKEV